MSHTIIFTTNTLSTKALITKLIEDKNVLEPEVFQGLQGDALTKSKIEALIFEEEVHDIKTATKNTSQSLKSMSSGEQRKVVLEHLLNSNLDYLVLDNPFDNLDHESIADLKQSIEKNASKIIFIIVLSRKSDALDFITTRFQLLDNGSLALIDNSNKSNPEIHFTKEIPKPIKSIHGEGDSLINFKNIEVSFDEKLILKNINWEIKKNSFWQLIGKNGSGKTTLLSLITGENNKGYGQELYLFGKKKGTGETIWDIKQKIGYYTPTLTHNFKRTDTVKNMLISGLNDSIGLYKIPTENQLLLAKEWLEALNMEHLAEKVFIELPVGQQRLIMIGRAMIKHPLVLILDEPTENLDDDSAALFVALTNKIALETTTAIIFVSHREEVGLNPKNKFELTKTTNGSIGTITK
ncbi:ABC transporter related protein [Cellulophaga algicola DSM 14237]|uniref:ABC transporter related protein n=1 Tax=Cellulophaga algicola (strain DSM 14237 / IC166 / ACAM 630) TaxID=688270 RepID=E6XBL1_CELAD|nr:ATP-binding cassette domain-containing protein [Cellulophaga algicola]ADV47846.1 ABC transporter related protein [Cellulophaga algicola DSM 14237]